MSKIQMFCSNRFHAMTYWLLITIIAFLPQIDTVFGNEIGPGADDIDDRKIDSHLNSMGADDKRTGFLPARGRKLWPVFDWEDTETTDKRMSKFTPMRGRKADESSPYGNSRYYDDYSRIYSTGRAGGADNGADSADKRASFMPARGKKPMDTDDIVTGNEYAKQYEDNVDSNRSNDNKNNNKNNNNFIVDKKSRNFFGMRG